MIRRAWRVLRLLAIAYLGLLLVLLWSEKSLIFFPAKYPAGVWQMPPGVEEARFTAADGTPLHGWYAKHPSPRAVLLHAHGNAGNLTHRADILRTLHDDLGLSVLMFDYRGYGRSGGEPDEAGVLQDARAARAWLAARANVREDEIVLMGESLGTGVVVDLAARDGARGLILQSAFTSLPDVAAQIYSWIPVRWLMRTRLDSLSKIQKYEGPLLQLHGDADEIVPFSLAQELHHAVPSPQKVWHTIPGAYHNSVIPRSVYQAIDAWIDTLPQRE